ncbi:germin-like protein subfamily T member 1 [Henckelia pumila]|uniref:germin-like protein subfamily T member 1 n=1 Tax=Henckelia pumila TaxID=405737 RepID=UPI003C6E8F11
MEAKMISFFTMILFHVLILLLPIPGHSADSDPLQDFCIADLQSPPHLNGFPCKPAFNVTSDDFFYSGLVNEANTSNLLGSYVTQANVLAFPGLNTLGISINRVDIAVGGVTHPHTHPRATECGVLIQGKLLVGLISSGNTVYSRNLSVGEVFVIPRGLVHFQMNVGEEKVLVFTAFNSQMPGTIQISRNLFGSVPPVPDQILAKAFQVNQTLVDQIKSKFAA